MFLSLRETDYVMAARAIGVRWPGIVFPAYSAGHAGSDHRQRDAGIGGRDHDGVHVELFGSGVQEPTPSWGSMLTHAMQLPVLREMWWRWIPPALLIFVTVLAVNFIGDGLRDAADPMAIER